MVDFSKIRSYGDGQRHAFEELICQLARREPPSQSATFRRVEGAGGDGGVEAYWLLKNGRKVGYQAKFFVKCRDISWSQIDKSVDQALKVHTELSEYVIAIPSNLTDKKGRTSGWQEWEKRKLKWQVLARKKLRRAVKFTVWTASDIHDKLLGQHALGLRSYWFGDLELSSGWFRNHVADAEQALDERYHPEDHVQVHVQSALEFVVRSSAAKSTLSNTFLELEKLSFRIPKTQSLELPAGPIDAAKTAVDQLLQCQSKIDDAPWIDWNVAEWSGLATIAYRALIDLQLWIRDNTPALKPDSEDPDQQEVRRFLRDLSTFSDRVHSIGSVLRSNYLSADKSRVVLIEGRAGSGKSHFLASAADIALASGRPVLLLLGQHFRDQAIWPQIAQRLDMEGTASETLLGALDSAGEAARTRSLILIDAINEGAGAGLWRRELGQVIAQIRRYPNLALAISCRTEYVGYAIHSELLASLSRFEVHGFVTPQEQESAARVYMDRRGISRPATPWLAPEFTNPLFLRSTCIALQREGKREFPRGLHGAKEIFSFFIESVARHLGTDRDGGGDLVGPTKATLRLIAEQMAVDRADFVVREDALSLASAAFKLFPAPSGQTWLDVLQRNGLIRYDPEISPNEAGAFGEPREIVRFSFQRFQDHLMAEALLLNEENISAALAAGTLAFIHTSRGIEPRWQGLVEALSIQIPEKFGVELLDVLPGSRAKWIRQPGIFDAFIESVRWRSKLSFSDATLAILNQLPSSRVDSLTLLIELSVSIDHPWNAELLHRNLAKKRMPERDRFWTIVISQIAHEDHPIGVLINWCLNGQTALVQRETRWLAAITLTWALTSTNRWLRDSSTKALTSLLILQEDLFPQLADLFHKIDDQYVLERIWAASYAAVCHDPSPVRIARYAQITADLVFGKEKPPESILLRDYGAAIVELAIHRDCLPVSIDLKRCTPPFGSPQPRLTVTKRQLERIASVAGDDRIVWSCSEFGEFGRDRINHTVTRFVPVTLKSPPPYTQHEIFDNFVKDVIDRDHRRKTALGELRSARSLLPFLRVIVGDEVKPRPPTMAQLREQAKAVQKAQRKLLALLTPAERSRFTEEVVPYLDANRSASPKNIDQAGAARWIAKRAYDLGWTKKLFLSEPREPDYLRERGNIQSISIKYQWIALNNLLCRLADNYWLGGSGADQTKRYQNALDIPFLRDVEPTILKLSQANGDDSLVPEPWKLGPRITIHPVNDESLLSWPFKADPAKTFPSAIDREDTADRRWLVLYDHRSDTLKGDPRQSAWTAQRQNEFQLVFSVIVLKSHRTKLVAQLSSKRQIDVMTWRPIEEIDGPLLLEAPWRSTWPQETWHPRGRHPEEISIAPTVYQFRWESHLDKSLPEGASAYLPAPWLAKKLQLVPNPDDLSCYVDAHGTCRFVSLQSKKNECWAAFIDKGLFYEFLRNHNLECVWICVSERNAFPGGMGMSGSWRRAEGLAWRKGKKLTSIKWTRDNKRQS